MSILDLQDVCLQDVMLHTEVKQFIWQTSDLK